MKSSSEHIVFICSRLDLPGGIERAIVNTANLFYEHGIKTSLLILDETNNSFYPINAGVTIFQVSLSFGIKSSGNLISRKYDFLHDIKTLKRFCKNINATILIATEYPFSIAIAIAKLSGVKTFSWEHHHYHELKKSRFWQVLFQLYYPKLNGVICLNSDEQKLFYKHNNLVAVIPNFVTSLNKNYTNRQHRKKLLTIGRLTAVKGTDRLLKIALSVLKRNSDWKWKLIGDGDMKDLVLNFIQKHNLEDKLILQLPVTSNINLEYQNASIYIMCSRNECFPMTLLEAMSQGLPCIAYNCETGPRHIIQHDINGLLVTDGDEFGMVKAIETLMNNHEQLEKMHPLVITSINKFSPSHIFDCWMAVLNDLDNSYN